MNEFDLRNTIKEIATMEVDFKKKGRPSRSTKRSFMNSAILFIKIIARGFEPGLKQYSPIKKNTSIG